MDFKDDNFTDFNKYDFDPDKSFNFEDIICRRKHSFLPSCNYDMGWKTIEENGRIRRKNAEERGKKEIF